MSATLVAEQQGGSTLTLIAERFRRDVLTGLSRAKKTLPCKYLYDEPGARLFEVICGLKEYYPTRTETGILQRYIEEIVALLGPNANLVELGSGSGRKTQLLLEHLDQPSCYCPVDISWKQLFEYSGRLTQRYPGLVVQPVCADYTDDFELRTRPFGSGSTTVFFPGSTIGNFEPDEAVLFLRRIGGICGPAGGLLLGVDLKKAPQVLIPAYNDSRGITAKFNLNLLARANRELQADFDLSQFEHHATYNETAHRIEMHLVSRRRQQVSVDGSAFAFTQGESIVTEHSYKYTIGEFRQLAAKAGFELVRHWTDERRWFGVLYLKPCKDGTNHNGKREDDLLKFSNSNLMAGNGLGRESRSPAVELVNVSKNFDSLVALSPTSLAFESGKTTVLIGPSGCGKSTVLRLIIGLVHPTTGQVRFDGRVITPENILELRRRMGYVIQEGGLFPHLTASENILLLSKNLCKPEEEMRKRMAELCDLTRLPSAVLSRYPVELSGGQRQRVSLIRALMLKPEVLLLDEPMAALDPMVRVTLQTELKAVFQHLSQTVILVTHELAEAAWLGDQIVLLRQGRVVQAGTFAGLRDHPADEFVSEFVRAQRRLALE